MGSLATCMKDLFAVTSLMGFTGCAAKQLPQQLSSLAMALPTVPKNDKLYQVKGLPKQVVKRYLLRNTHNNLVRKNLGRMLHSRMFGRGKARRNNARTVFGLRLSKNNPKARRLGRGKVTGRTMFNALVCLRREPRTEGLLQALLVAPRATGEKVAVPVVTTCCVQASASTSPQSPRPTVPRFLQESMAYMAAPARFAKSL